MSLMTDSGDTKDDVKIPDNDVGEKIHQMFTTEEKECSKLRSHSKFLSESILIYIIRHCRPHCHGRGGRYGVQGGS